ncbi:MAG: fumarylacetoacetate hydrolase family protein [Candidatus Tectomicrobia bacterium]|nr:fumarylacetoacetate hydrolase family protein [Candidatus Tectomicrobia bacterium]
MKLAMFYHREKAPQEARLGAVLQEEKVVDLFLLSHGERVLRDTLTFLEGGEAAHTKAALFIAEAEQALSSGRKLRGTGGEIALSDFADLVFLPPVPRPGKIIATGLNYIDHAQEVGSPTTQHIPRGFIKVTSTLIGHEAFILYPQFTTQLDYEVELAIVIGKEGKNIPKESAYDYIAGYTIFNDLSARDAQRNNTLFGKNFDTSGPMGPFLVLKDEIPNPQHLSMTLRVNGELRQNGSTSNMIFKIADLLTYWSQITLYPGDIIASGTPSGVAAGHKGEPSWFLKPGDVVEAEIEGLGLLRNRVMEK